MTDFLGVVEKIYNVLSEDHVLANEFYQKWGVSLADFKRKITDPLTHGGYVSKLKSIENLEIRKETSVLDIGPEMGLEVFMLAELTDKVTVCDPDVSNLKLISDIARKYIKDGGVRKGVLINFEPLGFGNDVDSIARERTMYNDIVEKLGHSLPAFYNIASERNLNILKEEMFDLIFIHKILTTITRSKAEKPFVVFCEAIEVIKKLLKVGGVCSWTEPEFVWEQKRVLNNLTKIKGVIVEKIEYHPKELPEKFVQLFIYKVHE
ncbi:hypothetical protein A2572_02295 [Candidatus Collierbacteria bacterium RIFOXYD1_FULL_40_9]|uniref:Methyltransferase domain-containing protein n=1 Tax=Candidatus Collierbacteria bacterium RIFOXYD1_FULL_40_9 TaxID=1817731 RepID=A0A1F5FNZ7_9BACT|nr:MAG: hypothetical protein A2572_02295 [Candidatus Collierbacteria bacterium RIFOXYD1_FULL_40_9]